MVVYADAVARHRIVKGLVYVMSVLIVIFGSAEMLVSAVMAILSCARGFVPSLCHRRMLLELVFSSACYIGCKNCVLEC